MADSGASGSRPRTLPEHVARLRPFLLASLLLLHAGLLVYPAWANSPTIDEVAHLPAGLSYWQWGRFDLYRVNPPLVRLLCALPVLAAGPTTDWSSYDDRPGRRSEWQVGRDFIAANGERAFWYFTLARWACLPLSLLAGFVCYCWAQDLYGTAAGFLALLLWCLEPTVLAWGSTITPDSGAAASGVLAGYSYWRWLREPAWSRCLLAGLALGLAELTKTTWIILLPLWPLLWGVSRWPQRRCRARHGWLREGAQMAVLLLVGLYVLNAGYGFEGSFTRLDRFPFFSCTLSGRAEPGQPPDGWGNRFAGTWLGAVPVPLPANYVSGIDLQKGDFERGGWSYLRGEHRYGGWWYYYLYALAVKLPLGIWGLGLLALGVTVGQTWTCHKPLEQGQPAAADWRGELVLLAPAVVVFVLVSSQTGFSRNPRYVLPCYPFAFIWIGQVARALDQNQRGLVLVQGILLSWALVSSLSVYPHSLSYFNELTGGPEKGHEHLLDAALDWGQDLHSLRRWRDQHRGASPLHLAYYGAFNPQHAGVAWQPIPPAPQPGWYALSVHFLRRRTQEYAYFLRHRPVARAGYSIYVYHLNTDDANQVRQERGLPLLDTSRRP